MGSACRITRASERDVSAIKATFSRVKSSTTVRMRNRLPSVNASETKSRLQRWFAASGTPIGLRVPKARFRPPLRRTCNFSSAYMRHGFSLCVRRYTFLSSHPEAWHYPAFALPIASSFVRPFVGRTLHQNGRVLRAQVITNSRLCPRLKGFAQLLGTRHRKI